MKSSLAFVTILFLPDVFAVAVPHVPNSASKRFPRAVQVFPEREVPAADSVPVKRDATPEPERQLTYFKEAAAKGVEDLKPRELSEPEVKELKPRRGSPLVVSSPAAISATFAGSSAGTSAFPTTTLTGAVGYLPSDPAQSLHNSIVGSHPFYGHGPAIQTPAPSYVGEYDTNLTLVVPVHGTVPPIANATGTIYTPVETAECPPRPVPEYLDSDGSFLPTDQQPGYNGSISTNGTIPGNCSATINTPIPEDKVLIQGHMEGNNEIVEIDIVPIPNNETKTYYGAGFTPIPTDSPAPSNVSGIVDSSTPSAAAAVSSGGTSTGPGSSSTGTGTRQRVPDAGNPGFTGPKVRDLHAGA